MSFNKNIFLFCIITLGFITITKASSIFINEFQASNLSTIKDESGEYEDWIEIYNASDSTINIGGLFISDDPSELTKWRIPDTSSFTQISTGGYLLLWADSDTTRSVSHVGFKLSASGESIILTNKDSITVIDRIDFAEQYADISYGRQPDGSVDWFHFNQPTPKKSNSTSGSSDRADEPVFLTNGGFYDESFYLSLYANSGDSSIFYTLNGNDPSHDSYQYLGPIEIASTSVVRARVIVDGLLPSNIITNSYFFDQNLNLAVVSLVSDSANIWGSSGIYSNRFKDWEKPVHIEFFGDDLQFGFNLEGGMKIHSPDARPQQSLRIYARSKYGNDQIDYQLFEDKDVNVFKVFILRNGGNDGSQVTNGTHIRDPFMHVLYYNQNPNNEISAYRPVHVFLNGQYWGIYNLRERHDKDYIQYNREYFGPIDFLERAFDYPGNRNAIEGDWEDYNALDQYIATNDLKNHEHFNYVAAKMDIDNFADYWMFEVFAGNFDWLSNNIKYWRPKTFEGRWKWVMWDTDHGLGLPHRSDGADHGDVNWNTLAWATGITGDRVGGGANTLIIRGLLENNQFKTDFINRFADLLNETLSFKKTNSLLNQILVKIGPDFHLQTSRWGKPYATWQSNINTVRNYLQLRPDRVRDHIMEKFELSGIFDLSINIEPNNAGKIQLNTITIDTAFWEGTYFNSVPLKLNPITTSNYIFKGWEYDSTIVDSSQTTGDSLILFLSNDFTITAKFEIDTFPGVIINEINYKSSDNFETGDWIELYNPRNFPIDISGWVFEDDDDTHGFIFPQNTVLASDSFIVLCEDGEKFQNLFPNVSNSFGDLGFGLSRNGELLRLFDDRGNLIDSLTYKNNLPWPPEANGLGYTLELIDPNLENFLPEHWAASQEIGGTPGRVNSQLTTIKQEITEVPGEYYLSQNYPNPFNSITKIKYSIKKEENVVLQVYNTRGQLVETLVNEWKHPGTYVSTWDAKTHSTGIYFYILKTNQEIIDVKKAIYIK